MDNRDIRITYDAARVNVGLTQKEAAKILKISQSTLFKYENGTNIPQWDRHEKMAELYGIPKEMLCSPRNRPIFIMPTNSD